MTFRIVSVGVAATLLGISFGILGGCVPPDAEETPPPARPAFEGKVDTELAGTWKSKNGDSVLKLGEDGGLTILATSHTPGGKETAERTGNWLVSEGKLRMKYRLPDGTDEIVGYSLKHEGKSMTLSTKTPKRDTQYTRQ
ncbi:MAG: hypothetical protein ACO1SV_01690 [Fimbriimonas sp.]